MTLTKVTYSMIQGAAKSALDYGADSTWPVGTEIYKTSPTSGGPNSWVKTTTGFKATANLA